MVVELTVITAISPSTVQLARCWASFSSSALGNASFTGRARKSMLPSAGSVTLMWPACVEPCCEPPPKRPSNQFVICSIMPPLS